MESFVNINLACSCLSLYLILFFFSTLEVWSAENLHDESSTNKGLLDLTPLSQRPWTDLTNAHPACCSDGEVENVSYPPVPVSASLTRPQALSPGQIDMHREGDGHGDGGWRRGKETDTEVEGRGGSIQSQSGSFACACKVFVFIKQINWISELMELKQKHAGSEPDCSIGLFPSGRGEKKHKFSPVFFSSLRGNNPNV